VSITLDPITDTPEVLRRYAARHGIDLGTWQFLTGPPVEVTHVIRAFRVDSVAGERLAHGRVVVLVDTEGRIAERRTDLELDAEGLLASLRRLLG